MKIRVFPADNYGCGHYRAIWPTQVLQAQAEKHGHEIVMEDVGTRSLSAHVDHEKQIVMEVNVPDADVIVLQRITHRYLAQAIPMLRARGITVVIDMDDDLSTIYPRNPAYAALNPDTEARRGTNHSWIHAEIACAEASLVTVSALALARRYARHNRYRVLHNCVPEKVFDIPHEDSDLVGYPGAMHSHANDIPMLGSSISRIMRNGGQFATIADTTGIRNMLRLPRDVDMEFGPVSVEEWWPTIAQLGIGLAPLAKTTFNNSKSWLKPLEMSAVGVPCVISPRTEYQRIHKLGVGTLAESTKDWYDAITQLMKDPILRHDSAQQAKEAVRHLTYEQQAHQWLEAWEYARELDLSA